MGNDKRMTMWMCFRCGDVQICRCANDMDYLDIYAREENDGF